MTHKLLAQELIKEQDSKNTFHKVGGRGGSFFFLKKNFLVYLVEIIQKITASEKNLC
jgi:hypothetical protein